MSSSEGVPYSFQLYSCCSVMGNHGNRNEFSEIGVMGISRTILKLFNFTTFTGTCKILNL